MPPVPVVPDWPPDTKLNPWTGLSIKFPVAVAGPEELPPQALTIAAANINPIHFNLLISYPLIKLPNDRLQHIFQIHLVFALNGKTACQGDLASAAPVLTRTEFFVTWSIIGVKNKTLSL